MDRIILHCDCNCFYASCELLSHPDLRQLPVAVCGDPTERHGIILAKNEPAKRCGVKTAETIWKAKQKCPGLILLPPHHRLYAEYSKKINAVYGEYTDLVEPFGIDESWLDITGSMHLFGGDPVAIADELRRRGFTVFDSATNFLFATTDRMPCVEIFEKLRARGILIRHFNAPRISDYLRITIGTPEQMQRFFAALDEILGE